MKQLLREELFVLLVLLGFATVSCTENSRENPSFSVEAGGQSGAAGGGTGGSAGTSTPPADCVENPTTHIEIINACTDAVKVEKTPRLEGLNPDGSLPPLP